jgi:hypothetical protein
MMMQVDRMASQSTRMIRSAHPARPVLIGLGVLTLIGMVTSPSPLLVLASGVVALFIVVSLWRPGELPILLLPAFLQFMSVALKPVTTAFNGKPLQDLSENSSNLEPAALFALAGIAALALGLRLGIGRVPARTQYAGIDVWPFKRVLALSLVVIVTGHVLEPMAARFGGARQIVLAMSGIESAGLFVLAYTVLRLRRGVNWLIGVVAIEIILGMIGFFGNFKMTVIVVLSAVVATQRKLGARGIMMSGLGAMLAFILAVFWTSGKAEYRAFLNRGTNAQVVLQPFDERLGYLGDKVAEFDGQKFEEGVTQLLARISYIDFLAATMTRVPEVIPHEDGGLVGKAIWHVLTPRILFPDKPALRSDTEVTAYYTNLNAAVFAWADTSISIGYLGELYIDFGILGSLIAVFLMSLAFGRFYRAIRDHPRVPSFANYGFCLMLGLGITSFEISLIKMIGGVVMIAAIVLALQRLAWPALISRNVSASVSARPNIARGIRG